MRLSVFLAPRRPRALVALAVPLALSGALLSTSAAAQPAHEAGYPRQPPGSAPPAVSPTAPAAPLPAAPDTIAIALAPKAGGLTPDQVGKRAAGSRASVRSRRADLEAAASRVDQAMVSYFPRLSLTASYTRLSPVAPFALSAGGYGLVVAPLGSLGVSPCPAPATAGSNCVTGAYSTGVSFPVPVNNSSLVASLAVPISDYIFRTTQSYGAATHDKRSKAYSVVAEELQVAADAKLAYYNWVGAVGSVVVSDEAVEQAKLHVEDARKLFSVGLASRADVLRLEAQVASAQQMAAQSVAFADVAAEQLRTVTGLPAGAPIAIGSDPMHDQASPPAESLDQLLDLAFQRRLEIRSLDQTELSMRDSRKAIQAGYGPRVDGFADGTYANPNQRIFPATQVWNGTWDVGVRLSWTLNDTFTTLGASAEQKARIAQIVEQKAAIKEGLRGEVASALADAKKSVATIEASDRGLVAAEETLRVRRELFRNGKATSVDIVDAETELTRAQLNRLSARIGMLTAKVRIEHAIGRDVPAKPLGDDDD